MFIAHNGARSRCSYIGKIDNPVVMMDVCTKDQFGLIDVVFGAIRS